MRPIIIWDIDGTLANCDERLPYLLNEVPPNWEAFDSLTLSDTPIEQMVTLNQLLSANMGINIVLLTSRNDTVREMTEEWLDLHSINYDSLEMRKDGDHRSAAIVKIERLGQLGYAPEDVITIFEDDPHVTTKLREAGYHVCLVDDRPYVHITNEGGRP